MKIYTHPTIYLPAGATVVKFYDDTLSGTETTPDIIVKDGIGDVEDGFDLSLGEFRVGSCDFKLRNKNNYVLGTLLNTTVLKIAVLIDDECYFYGNIDFNTIVPDTDIDPSADLHYSNINFTAIGALSAAQYISLFALKDYVSTYESSIYSDVNFFYLDRILQGLCAMLGIGTTVQYECERIYSHLTDLYKLKDLIFDILWLSDTGAAWPNAYQVDLNNAFNFLGVLTKEFFFYPAVVYDGANFQLKIIEKDCGSVITLPPVKKRAPASKYLMHSIISSLENMPEVPSGTDIGTIYEFLAGRQYGDDLQLDFHHTNIYKKFYAVVVNEAYATIANGDTLSSGSPITINVDSTSLFPPSGSLYLISGSGIIQFNYLSKTSNTLTGCTIASSTFTFYTSDKISVDGTNNVYTLSVSPINIKVDDTSIFNYGGNLTIINGTNSQAFNYTSKTATAFTGCTIDSGTFDFILGNEISLNGTTYITNLALFVNDLDILIDKITNPDSSEYATLHEAIITAYKNYYYDNNNWVDYTTKGLKADGYLQNILPGKQFLDSSKTYLIHTVKRSAINNETILTCLQLS